MNSDITPLASLQSRCAGSCWPDYLGGSLLNLMQTLSGELGGPDLGFAPLGSSALAGIGRHRHVCLLLIDGLGVAQLRRHGPGSCLASRQHATLSSVFPATTAAAVTSVLTGRSPATHGLIGWHQLHGEAIIAPLPLYTRHTSTQPIAPQQLADSLFCAPPLFECFARNAALLLPQEICDSPCSRHHAGHAQRQPYRDLDDAFAQLQARITAPQPAFHYLYLPHLDRLMHEIGPDAAEVTTLFERIDEAVAQLLIRAAACDTAVVAIADHGFVAAPEAQWLDVDGCADVYALLARPLSGETRLAYCHVKQGQVNTFIEAARTALGHACWVEPGAALLQAGAFGPGPMHTDLAHRCGDVVLIAKPGWNLRDTLPGERPHRLAGVHAGVTLAEMEIPLVVFSPDPLSNRNKGPGAA
jgi:hypothetical protein